MMSSMRQARVEQRRRCPNITPGGGSEEAGQGSEPQFRPEPDLPQARSPGLDWPSSPLSARNHPQCSQQGDEFGPLGRELLVADDAVPVKPGEGPEPVLHRRAVRTASIGCRIVVGEEPVATTP